MEYNKQENTDMQVTGKQIENIFLVVIATLLAFTITTFFIIPGISFIRFFAIEMTISIIFRITSRISKRK